MVAHRVQQSSPSMPGSWAIPGAAARPELHGDFSLNVTNSITAGWVLDHGLTTLTAAHDLDRDQLLALLDHAPAGRIAGTMRTLTVLR